MGLAEQLAKEIGRCLETGTLSDIENRVRQAELLYAVVDSHVGKVQLGFLLLLRGYTIKGGGSVMAQAVTDAVRTY